MVKHRLREFLRDCWICRCDLAFLATEADEALSGEVCGLGG